MKVRFSHPKEQKPTVDGGLKVVYAPGKRAAFQIRWYLILLLVASPLLWFIIKLFLGMLLVEAPARVAHPSLEIRALESGMVQQLHIAAGDQISPGDLLISLDNPAVFAQQQALTALLAEQKSADSPQRRQHEAHRQLTERAKARVQELDRLVALGAATRRELDHAWDLWIEHQATQAAFEQQLQTSAEQQSATTKRAAQLKIQARSAALVKEVLVTEGEAVGPGTALLNVTTDQQPEIHAYLDPRHRILTGAGQPLQLKLPDGQWVAAHVISEPQVISRLPVDLRTSFGNNEPKLLVKIAPDTALASKWQLDGLPMTARFPTPLLGWFQ